MTENLSKAQLDIIRDHYARGRRLLKRGRINEAVAAFRDWAQVDPRAHPHVEAYASSFMDEEKALRGEPYVGRLRDVLVETESCSILDRGRMYAIETVKNEKFNCAFVQGRMSPDRGTFIVNHPDPVQRIEQPCVFVGGDGNYSHWLTRSLIRLSLIEGEESCRRLPILINEDLHSFQRESLDALGVGADRWLGMRRESVLHCREIVVPVNLRNHRRMDFGVDWLRRRLGLIDDGVGVKKRDIYVSRADATLRPMLNEDALTSRLEAMGFEIVVLGRLSFEEQVATFSQAHTVVGPRGAGMTNLIFAPRGCRVIERASRAIRHMRDFEVIAQVRNQGYDCIVTDDLQPTGQPGESPMHSPYRVDVDAVMGIRPATASARAMVCGAPDRSPHLGWFRAIWTSANTESPSSPIAPATEIASAIERAAAGKSSIAT